MAKWIFIKFKGDMAIYAACPKCKFIHAVSDINANFEPVVTKQYRYCPMCGRYRYVKGSKISIEHYNNFDITQLYNGEYKKYV